LELDNILADPRFALLNEPFKAGQAKADFVEDRNNFLKRRHKLLEQALVIEEQLRRVGNQFEQLDKPVFEDDEVQFVSSSGAGDRFTKLVVANHQLTRRVLPKNGVSAAMVYKSLLQLNAMLQEMRSDVSRMSVKVDQLPSVCDQLKVDKEA
jgi:hypothetical protein